MDRQKAYDTAKAGLLAQNRKSSDERGFCRLRGFDGTKCAIGFMIPDDMYDPGWEGGTVDEVLFKRGQSGLTLADVLGVNDSDVGFLAELQSIHDNSAPVNWGWRLEKFATKRGLIP